MRLLFAACILSFFSLGCSEEPSLTEEDERFVQVTLALMRARANVAQMIDTTAQNSDTTVASDSVSIAQWEAQKAVTQSARLRLAIDSVYKRFEIDSVEYHKLSVGLVERPKVALLAHQAIRDSLGIK